MVLLPGCLCCLDAKCMMVRFNDWEGRHSQDHTIFAYKNTQLSFDPAPSLPFTTFSFLQDWSGEGSCCGGITILVDESLIRCTITLQASVWSAGKEIVLERQGAHGLLSGETVTVSDVVKDTLTAADPSPGYYGKKKYITNIGTISIRLDPSRRAFTTTDCAKKCSPQQYGQPEFSPETHTLLFQNISPVPNGPRSFNYVDTQPQDDSKWNDGFTYPGVPYAPEYLPRGPELRPFDRYSSSFAPPNYRYVSPGCDAYLSRLASPIVLRKVQGDPSSWASDPIQIQANGYFDVKYVFSFQYLTQQFSYACGRPTLSVYRLESGSWVRKGYRYSTNALDYLWRRLQYQQNPSQFSADLANTTYPFGEPGDPFATVSVGGAYSPETVVTCPGVSQRVPYLSGCNGSCPAQSVTVTLDDSEYLPGGSYSIPISAGGLSYEGTFTLPDGLVRTVSLSFIELYYCACDAAYRVTVSISDRTASYSQFFRGAIWSFPTSPNNCYGACLQSGSYTATNQGKGTLQIGFPPSAIIDVPSSVQVTV